MTLDRRPKLSQQFDPRDATSHVDCAATAGAILADADSRGVFTFTHGQVRAATNEPVPDPRSPGLNWTQVDAALFRLTRGQVDLDVHSLGSPWAPVVPALVAGRWAGLSVIRGVLVDAGYGGGSTFRGAHAITAGYDHVRRCVIVGDPLVPAWLVNVPPAVLEAGCRALVVGAGAPGGAYYALTRDVFDEAPDSRRYSALFAGGSYWAYDVVGGAITGREALRFSGPTSAPCEAPALVPWPGHGRDRKLVRVTAGGLKGRYVEPGSTNVSLKVTAR